MSITSPWWNGWRRRGWVSAGWIELRTRPFSHSVMSQQVNARRYDCCCKLFFSLLQSVPHIKNDFFKLNFIFSIQKHVMTAEKWLDRQVSASLNKGFVILNKPGNKTVDEIFKERCWFFIWKPVKSVQSTCSHSQLVKYSSFKQQRSTFPLFILASVFILFFLFFLFCRLFCGSRVVSASLQQHFHVIISPI